MSKLPTRNHTIFPQRVACARGRTHSCPRWSCDRRAQIQFRKVARKVEWDRKFLLQKLNPLADWILEEVWNHVREHDVPYNILHDRDYPSIGCMPCTRRILSPSWISAARLTRRTLARCPGLCWPAPTLPYPVPTSVPFSAGVELEKASIQLTTRLGP
jgi:phosphoadenosine phosphosulfate reductase family protein